MNMLFINFLTSETEVQYDSLHLYFFSLFSKNVLSLIPIFFLEL